MIVELVIRLGRGAWVPATAVTAAAASAGAMRRQDAAMAVLGAARALRLERRRLYGAGPSRQWEVRPGPTAGDLLRARPGRRVE